LPSLAVSSNLRADEIGKRWIKNKKAQLLFVYDRNKGFAQELLTVWIKNDSNTDDMFVTSADNRVTLYFNPPVLRRSKVTINASLMKTCKRDE